MSESQLYPQGAFNGDSGGGAIQLSADDTLYSTNSSISNPEQFGTRNIQLGYRAGNSDLNPNENRNNIFIGNYSGQRYNYDRHNSQDYSSVFIGHSSGRYLLGGYSVGIGTNSLSGHESYPLFEITQPVVPPNWSGTYILKKDGDISGYGLVFIIRTTSDGNVLFDSFNPIEFPGSDFVIGETISVSGTEIGGISPDHDFVITVTGLLNNESELYWQHFVAEGEVAIGYQAGQYAHNTFGSIYIGSYAGRYAGQDSFNNIMIGRSAGKSAYVGFYNIYIGSYAGYHDSDGFGASFSNTFIGTRSGYRSRGAFYQTFVGAYSGQNLNHEEYVPQNTLFGAWTAEDATTAVGNDLFGAYSGNGITTGSYNSMFGLWSGWRSITTQNCNAGFGAQVFFDATENTINNFPRQQMGSYNSSFGSFSSSSIPSFSTKNTAFGFMAFRGMQKSGTTISMTTPIVPAVIGEENKSYIVDINRIYPGFDYIHDYPDFYTRKKLKFTRDSNGIITSAEILNPGNGQFIQNPITILGTQVGGVSPDNDFTVSFFGQTNSIECSRNCFIGTYSGLSASDSFDNFFGGYFSGGKINGANKNVSIGGFSGFNLQGDNNILLGYNSGYSLTTGENNIFIGYNAGNEFTTESNRIVLGNNEITNAYINVSWTVTSDARDKGNIQEIPYGLDFIDQLNPIQYNWIHRETGLIKDEIARYGFLAQDIQTIDSSSILVDNSDPEHLKLRESMIIPILVKSIQELKQEIETLKQIINS